MEVKSELLALTGVRAVAAGWVVLHHYYPKISEILPSISVIQPFADAGFLGVELFFVLSGFIISLTYADKIRSFDAAVYASFLWRRLARIYPAYLAVLMGMVVIVLVSSHIGVKFNSAAPNAFSGLAFLASLFMVQGWGDGDWKVWNVVAWSVSVEWLAYLLFPFFASAIHHFKTAGAAITAGYVVLVSSLVLLTTGALATLMSIDFGNVLRILGCFSVGTTAYWLYRHQKFIQWPWVIITPALAVGIVLVGSLLAGPNLTATWSALLMGPFILGLAYSRDIVSLWLSGRAINYWGRVSYSLYLSHFIVLGIVGKVLPTEQFDAAALPVRVGLVFAYLAAAVAASMALYHWIEEPGRRIMQRLWNIQRRPTSATASSD